MVSSTPCFVLSAAQILSRVDELSDILETCVNNGASVSFMSPFNRDKSRPFWLDVAQSVTRGERIVLGAEDAQGALVGAVQLILNQPENQPHRADVAKLLVHTSARRGGVARKLMSDWKAAHVSKVKRCWCSIQRRAVALSCSTTIADGKK